MGLRYAVLALLRVGPMSGYELAKQFAHSVGHVWYAPDSQIYPELRRMEAAGLVEAEELPRGERATRRLYHVTPAGDEAFVSWLASPLDYQRVKDVAHLKAAYLEAVPADIAEAFFSRHLSEWQSEHDRWTEEIARIDALENAMLTRRLAVTAEADRARTIAYKRHTYEGLVSRARTEIEWARAGIALAQEHRVR
jgi:PadR family transcriptional regulator, regulatory protein AphA